MRTTVVIALACLCGSAASLDAQVVSPPARSNEGVFGGARPPSNPARRASHTVEMFFDVLGGFDDNIVPEGSGTPTDPFAPRRSGSTAVATGELRYRRTGVASSLQTNGRAHMNTFRNIGVRPLVGGDAGVRGSRRVGNNDLTAGVAGVYSPTFNFRLVDNGLSTEAPVPEDPTWGVSQVRSHTISGTASTTQHWSLRQHTSLTAAYSSSSYSTAGSDTKSTAADLGHVWDFSRNLGMQVRAARVDQVNESSADGNLVTYALSPGITFRKRLSRTRTIQLSAGPTASYVRTRTAITNEPVDYVAPAGFAAVRLDLGRTWAVASNWSREATMLNGVTRQSFLSNVMTASVGGDLSRRMEMTVTARYSNGKPHRGDTGSFEEYSGTAQLQFEMTSCCSLVSNYSFGHHKLRDVQAIPVGFPREFERNAARVGVRVWLPLYGNFSAGGRRASDRS